MTTIEFPGINPRSFRIHPVTLKYCCIINNGHLEKLNENNIRKILDKNKNDLYGLFCLFKISIDNKDDKRAYGIAKQIEDIYYNNIHSYIYKMNMLEILDLEIFAGIFIYLRNFDIAKEIYTYLINKFKKGHIVNNLDNNTYTKVMNIIYMYNLFLCNIEIREYKQAARIMLNDIIKLVENLNDNEKIELNRYIPSLILDKSVIYIHYCLQEYNICKKLLEKINNTYTVNSIDDIYELNDLAALNALFNNKNIAKEILESLIYNNNDKILNMSKDFISSIYFNYMFSLTLVGDYNKSNEIFSALMYYLKQNNRSKLENIVNIIDFHNTVNDLKFKNITGSYNKTKKHEYKK